MSEMRERVCSCHLAAAYLTQEALQVGMVRNKVEQGDCIDLLNALPDGTVDLVFADPPFNIGYEYDQYDDRRTREEYLEWRLFRRATTSYSMGCSRC